MYIVVSCDFLLLKKILHVVLRSLYSIIVYRKLVVFSTLWLTM